MQRRGEGSTCKKGKKLIIDHRDTHTQTKQAHAERRACMPTGVRIQNPPPSPFFPFPQKRGKKRDRQTDRQTAGESGRRRQRKVHTREERKRDGKNLKPN
mmetsp:Transcript_22575/g.44670  ORF Transcript_22575/g.44670 Transcript_22575/m.44670 type:complete len:100 (-) Transcript_22575:12-311(-)